MSSRAGYPITWTSYNLPSTIPGNGVSSSFVYGPDRKRIWQSSTYTTDGDVGTETTIYAGDALEIETTPAATHYKHFVAVPGGTKIIYDLYGVNASQTTYVTADHLGSGSLLINAAGSVLATENYSAYGYRRSANWAAPLAANSPDYATIASTTRRGYTDAFHEMIDNVGLIHMNGRMYDPVIGRFLSTDPMIAKAGNSQSENPYSYVENRPLTMTDPTGLEGISMADHPSLQLLNPGFTVSLSIDIVATFPWGESNPAWFAPKPNPKAYIDDHANKPGFAAPNPGVAMDILANVWAAGLRSQNDFGTLRSAVQQFVEMSRFAEAFHSELDAYVLQVGNRFKLIEWGTFGQSCTGGVTCDSPDKLYLLPHCDGCRVGYIHYHPYRPGVTPGPSKDWGDRSYAGSLITRETMQWFMTVEGTPAPGAPLISPTALYYRVWYDNPLKTTGWICPASSSGACTWDNEYSKPNDPPPPPK